MPNKHSFGRIDVDLLVDLGLDVRRGWDVQADRFLVSKEGLQVEFFADSGSWRSLADGEAGCDVDSLLSFFGMAMK